MRTGLIFVLLFVSYTKALAPDNDSPKLIKTEKNLLSEEYDVVVFVNDVPTGLGKDLISIENALTAYKAINPKVGNKLDVIPFPEHKSRKLIYASTGSLYSDVSDSHSIRTAVQSAFSTTTSLGLKKVLLVIGPMNTAHSSATWSKAPYSLMNAAMAALHKLFHPYIVRLHTNPLEPKCDTLGLFNYDDNLLKIIKAYGRGMEVLRDIGNTEPEVMVANTIVDYLAKLKSDWESSGITYTVEEPTEEDYPMCHRVNRGASVNPNHVGKIIIATYKGFGEINQTLLLVGKGITFDSGGHDLKINGNMNGMHNDKLGAATVAGFFEMLAHLKPEGLKVIGYMPYIRNDIGKLAYVADEIVTLTNGIRVRIGDTDAEGRVVLTDVLIKAKDQALKEVNPHIFTLATLTGAVRRSFGTYTAAMDNGPARAEHMAEKLMEVGDLVADPAEVVRIRYEDFVPNMPNSEYAEVEQYNTKPGSTSKRGFSFGAGYLLMVSQLDKHGVSSTQPLKYTHCDIYGAAEGITALASASPLRMFAVQFIVPRI